MFEVARISSRSPAPQERPAQGEDAGDRVLPAVAHARGWRTRRPCTAWAARDRVLGRQDDPRRRLLPGESIKDTVKMLEFYGDVIVMRHFQQGAPHEAAQWAAHSDHQRRRWLGRAPDPDPDRPVHRAEREGAHRRIEVAGGGRYAHAHDALAGLRADPVRLPDHLRLARPRCRLTTEFKKLSSSSYSLNYREADHVEKAIGRGGCHPGRAGGAARLHQVPRRAHRQGCRHDARQLQDHARAAGAPRPSPTRSCCTRCRGWMRSPPTWISRAGRATGRRPSTALSCAWRCWRWCWARGSRRRHMQTDLRGRDLIGDLDFSKEEVETVLDVAFDLKRKRAWASRTPTCVTRCWRCCSSSAARAPAARSRRAWRNWAATALSSRARRRRLRMATRPRRSARSSAATSTASPSATWTGRSATATSMMSPRLARAGAEHAVRGLPPVPVPGGSDDDHREEGPRPGRKKMVVSWAVCRLVPETDVGAAVADPADARFGWTWCRPTRRSSSSCPRSWSRHANRRVVRAPASRSSTARMVGGVQGCRCRLRQVLGGDDDDRRCSRGRKDY